MITVFCQDKYSIYKQGPRNLKQEGLTVIDWQKKS